MWEDKLQQIKELLENTELSHAHIAARVGVHQTTVSNYARANYSPEYCKARACRSRSNCKRGDLNPLWGRRGEAGVNYRGGVTHMRGYVMLLRPGWYTGRGSGRGGVQYVEEHRLVVCQQLGLSKIPDGWHVHHCDGVKDNNSFENLVLLSHADHNSLHKTKGNALLSKEDTLKWVAERGTPWTRAAHTEECTT